MIIKNKKILFARVFTLLLLFVLLPLSIMAGNGTTDSDIILQAFSSTPTTLQCGRTYTSADIDIIKSGSIKVSQDGTTLYFTNLVMESELNGLICVDIFKGATIEVLTVVLKGENRLSTKGDEVFYCRGLDQLILRGDGSLTLCGDYIDFSLWSGSSTPNGELIIDNTTVISQGYFAVSSCRNILVKASRFEGNYIGSVDNLTMEGCYIRVPFNGWFDTNVRSFKIKDEDGNTANHFIITTPEDNTVPSKITFLDQTLYCNHTYTSADFSDIKSGSFSVSESGRELTFDNLVVDNQTEERSGVLFESHNPLIIVLKGSNSVKTSKSVVVGVTYCGNLTITGDGSLTTKSHWYDFWTNECDVVIDNTNLNCEGWTAIGNNMWATTEKIIVNNSTFKGRGFSRIASLTLINSAFISPSNVVFDPTDEHGTQLYTPEGQKIWNFEIQPVEGDFNYRVYPSDFNDILIAKGDTQNVTFSMKNEGIEEIRKITYYLYVDGVLTQKKTISLGKPYPQTGDYFTVSIPVEAGNEVGDKELKIKITKVNGKTNTSPHNIGKGVLHVIGEKKPKRVVVEEFTGTWCPWCPRGTVGIEMLNSEYGDDIITIAIHNSDPMKTSSYKQGSSSYPSAKVNRGNKTDPYYGDSDEPFGIRKLVEEELNIITPAGFDVSAVWSDDSETSIQVNTKTTFLINGDASNYSIGLALLEDGMTGSDSGWIQKNNYSGLSTNDPNLQPLTELPSNITDIEYDYVAVDAWGITEGINGSITDIQANTPQRFSYVCDISANELIQDKSRLSVVALLFDNRTGKICNAAKTFIQESSPTGIKELKATNSNEPSAVYSISGRKVQSSMLPKGVYIKNGRKIVVK